VAASRLGDAGRNIDDESTWRAKIGASRMMPRRAARLEPPSELGLMASTQRYICVEVAS
jgi:hypothetical protein